MVDDFEKQARKRIQKRKDSFDVDKKYKKNYRGDWDLKPAYVSHELNKVKGPLKETRRKELKAKAREFALRQASNPKKETKE